MQLLLTALIAAGGMTLSLGVAIAAEELIFGKVFRPLFVRQVVQPRLGQQR